MMTGVAQSITILGAVSLFYITDFVLISRYDRERQAEGSGRSWDYTLIALGVVVFLVLQPVLLPRLGVQIDAWWGGLVQSAGILLVAGALVLQVWSRLHLRQFYAERVEVQPEHYVVDTGPYAFVLHPLFTSFFMFVAGLFLINPAIPTLVVAIYAFWDFGRAARQEEALLSENLVGYAEYRSRTPRFLPRLQGGSGRKGS